MMRTSNPALNDKAFQVPSIGSEQMTVTGTVNKSFLLVAMVFVTGYWSWSAFFGSESSAITNFILQFYIPIIIVNLIVAFVIIFKKTTAPFLAPVYALSEGVLLGVISAMAESRYPGIAFQAIGCTLGVLVSLLFAYRSGMIKVTDKFRLGVVAATGGIFLIYFISMIMGFFGSSIPMIHESGPVGIGFSIVVVIIASMNLILDFDFIQQGARRGAPKYMEWYASFGLLVTLIWLYIEMLRLIAKARDK